MALSERERQMLEEMEEAIRAEDPRFASQMNGVRAPGGDRRRMALGIVGALAGLGLVLLGINTIIYYAPTLLTDVGFGATGAIGAEPIPHFTPRSTALSDLDRRRIGQIAGQHERPLAQPVGEFAQRRLARARQGHTRARRVQRGRHGPTDAARSAGDQSVLSGQVEHQCLFLLR
mgnify:CR=1 FL=1